MPSWPSVSTKRSAPISDLPQGSCRPQQVGRASMERDLVFFSSCRTGQHRRQGGLRDTAHSEPLPSPRRTKNLPNFEDPPLEGRALLYTINAATMRPCRGDSPAAHHPIAAGSRSHRVRTFPVGCAHPTSSHSAESAGTEGRGSTDKPSANFRLAGAPSRMVREALGIESVNVAFVSGVHETG